jgi:hypothetical protein
MNPFPRFLGYAELGNSYVTCSLVRKHGSLNIPGHARRFWPMARCSSNICGEAFTHGGEKYVQTSRKKTTSRQAKEPPLFKSFWTLFFSLRFSTYIGLHCRALPFNCRTARWNRPHARLHYCYMSSCFLNPPTLSKPLALGYTSSTHLPIRIPSPLLSSRAT